MKKVLLLLMAIIVGTGFLSAQDPLYTVLFGKEYNKDNTIQDYLSTWEVTVSNDNNKTLTITNFNNNKGGWSYIKCGRKNDVSVATITTTEAVSEPLEKIVLTIDAITANNINSIKLLTSNTNNFSNPIETVDCPLQTGDQTLTLTNATANLYYQLKFDCKKGSNGVVQVSKIQYFAAETGPAKEDVALTWSKSVDNINLGDEYTAPTLTINPEAARSSVQYKSSNESLVVVENGTIILKEGVAGTATITASIPATNKQYKATPAEYTVKVTDPNAPTGYKLVTDVRNLKNGTKIIIVNTDNSKALSTTQNTNNRKEVDIEITDGQVEPGETVQIITLQKDGNNYALYATGGTEGYLAANSNSSNNLKTFSTIAWATISIDNNGDATIVFNGTNSRNTIMYNSSSHLFACYASTATQSPVQIYALPNTYKVDAPMSVKPVDYVVNGKVLGSANKLSLKPTIYVNDNPESDLTGYEIYLDDTKIGDAIDGEISGFAYTGADQKFTLHDGDNIIPFEVNGLTFETAPQIEGVEYLDETDVDGNTSHHVAFYVVPTATSQGLNWVVTAPEGIENGPDIFWRTHDTFKGAACHFYNINEDGTGVPESFEVRISYPIAIPNTPAQGARLMANETSEYTYKLYHAASVNLPTTGFEKNNDNTSTSGVADVAVDQDAEVEFFNLQGVRVEGELTPGLYIRRQGNQATKVVVK